MKKTLAILIIPTVILIILFSYTMNPSVTIFNTGTIKTVGVTTDTEFIDWGMIEPNSSKT